jgi:hypothetical protein
MKTGFKFHVRAVGCLSVVLATLWVNGFACALCCTDCLFAARPCAIGGAACHMEQKDDCCNATQCRSKEPPRSASSISRSGAQDCLLLPRTIPTVLRQSKDKGKARAAPVAVRLVFKPTPEQRGPLSQRPSSQTLLNRGSTYLRCCALLI